MAPEDEKNDVFSHEDHKVAYIFDPEEDEDKRERPLKRRRVSKQSVKKEDSSETSSLFVPLLNGAEKAEAVQHRQALFEASWERVDSRVQEILRDSNTATLDQVSAFVDNAGSECMDRIPSAFVITGPNIASQDLLFEQLSERLQRSTQSKFVRLRSSDTATLKAALKKIIRDVTAQVPGDDEDDLQIDQQDRRFLDYDLEALYVFSKAQACDHVFVAIQDSEGFDSGLLSELITLFHSWRPQIPFILLFGIATSVDLLQARLLKSSCRVIYGAQFDVVQTGTILETVFKSTVAACDVPLRLGAPLLQSMLGRQHDQVAGIQAFISSLKYAYMSHFYANPLNIFMPSDAVETDVVQSEHVEAVRNLPSFRTHVESLVERGTLEDLQHTRSLIEDDEYLLDHVKHEIGQQKQWTAQLIRSLLIMAAAGAQTGSFSKAYTTAMSEGISAAQQSLLTDRIRRLNAGELIDMLNQVLSLLKQGEPTLYLEPMQEDDELQDFIETQSAELVQLKAKTDEEGTALRSKYSGQSKVMRTTVIAQRVQLSQDSAALRDEDKRFTEIVDQVADMLASKIQVKAPKAMFLSECWLYDSRSPSRDVFVPRSRTVFERSLTRPQDYLGCSCCKDDDGSGVRATSPATAILYHLYLETGNLINVADLWSAFYAMVGEEEGDERTALVMFYRGLAELRALGFVKASKKKADHIAKLKWL